MARRGFTSEELKKKRNEKFNKLIKKRDNVTFENNRRNNNASGGGGKTSSKTKQGKPKTPAQILATKNIKKYGGTASAAKANKEAMRLKIKKKYLASKKKKK